MDLRNLANALKERLMPEREQSVFGMKQAYDRYKLETEMNGQPALEFRDWVKLQQQTQQAPRPQAPQIDFFKR